MAELESSRRHRFGQRRPPLSVTITGILEEYPDGQIFKVRIQNSWSSEAADSST